MSPRVALLAVLVAAYGRAQTFTPKELLDERVDPTRSFLTLQTAHFLVHFPEELAALASDLANTAEAAYPKVTGLLGSEPTGPTHLVVVHRSDRANTFTFVFPHRQIFVDVALPTIASGLNDYAAWHEWLLTHELTHIVHLDRRNGAYSPLAWVLGSWVRPNQWMPNWVKEGIAVRAETLLTPRGRGGSTTWRMMLRVAEADGSLAAQTFAAPSTIDSFERGDWPWGARPYLLGHALMEQVEGLNVFSETTAGSFPFRVDPGLAAVGLGSFDTLWQKTLLAVGQRADRELSELQREPFTPVEQLTHLGHLLTGLELSPNGKWLVVSRERPEEPNALLLMNLSGDAVSAPEALLERSTVGTSSFSASSRFLAFDRLARAGDNLVGELCLFDMKTQTVVSTNHDFRARDVAIHPDGRHVVFVANQQGKNRLIVTDSSWQQAEDQLGDVGYRRISTPRFSPDGSRLVFAMHNEQTGGEDLFLRERDGVTQLVADRAQNRSPRWTPDGETLVYASDRDGVFNLYALTLSTLEISRVTHVLGGLFEPVVDPEQRWVYALSYGSGGYDVVRLPWTPSGFTPVGTAEPVAFSIAASERSKAPAPPRAAEPYHGWHYLAPQYVVPSLLFRTDTAQLGLKVGAVDPLYLQFYELDLRFDTASLRPVGSFYYFDGRLRWAFDLRLMHDSAPVPGATALREVSSGIATLSIPLAGYGSVLTLRPSLTADLIRFEQPSNFVGVGLALRFDTEFRQNGYSFAEEGSFLNVAFRGLLRVPSPLFISSAELTARHHRALPWARHALHAGLEVGAFLTGREDPNALFYAGGQATFPFSLSSRYPLLGFPPNRIATPFLAVATVRYTFPIVDVQRGIGELPLFVGRLSGALLLQGALRSSDLSYLDPLWSAGLELWQDVTVGHIFPLTVRLGVYQGSPHFGGVTTALVSIGPSGGLPGS